MQNKIYETEPLNPNLNRYNYFNKILLYINIYIFFTCSWNLNWYYMKIRNRFKFQASLWYTMVPGEFLRKQTTIFSRLVFVDWNEVIACSRPVKYSEIWRWKSLFLKQPWTAGKLCPKQLSTLKIFACVFSIYFGNTNSGSLSCIGSSWEWCNNFKELVLSIPDSS